MAQGSVEAQYFVCVHKHACVSLCVYECVCMCAYVHGMHIYCVFCVCVYMMYIYV